MGHRACWFRTPSCCSKPSPATRREKPKEQRAHPPVMAAPSGGETMGGCQLLSKPPALEGVIGDKSAANMLKGEACDDNNSLFTMGPI